MFFLEPIRKLRAQDQRNGCLKAYWAKDKKISPEKNLERQKHHKSILAELK